MRIIVAVLHFLLILGCVYFFGKKWQVATSKLFWGAFLVRIAAGISLGVVYTYYYSESDTWQFFEGAKAVSSLGRTDFTEYLKTIFNFSENQPVLNGLLNQDYRTIFFIKIISVFSLLSLDNYWVCAAYFSLMAFICSWLLHARIIRTLPNSERASALAFLFFPSVVFWTSGIEKESVAICGIYFLVGGILTLLSSRKPENSFWWLTFPICFIVWDLKYYWAIILFISILTALITRVLISKFQLIKKYLILVWTALFFAIGALLSITHPNFYLHRFLEVVISNNNNFNAISDPKNLIHYFELDQTWWSLIVNAPWALLSGLFRPFVGEGHGVLGWLASIENFLVLLFSVGALMSIGRPISTSRKIILLAALSYCVVLCVFLALSTPNFGTLSRYRVGFLPVFIFIVVYQNPMLSWVLEKSGLRNLNFY